MKRAFSDKGSWEAWGSQPHASQALEWTGPDQLHMPRSVDIHCRMSDRRQWSTVIFYLILSVTNAVPDMGDGAGIARSDASLRSPMSAWSSKQYHMRTLSAPTETIGFGKAAQMRTQQQQLHFDKQHLAAGVPGKVNAADHTASCLSGWPCDAGNEYTCLERCGCAWDGSTCSIGNALGKGIAPHGAGHGISNPDNDQNLRIDPLAPASEGNNAGVVYRPRTEAEEQDLYNPRWAEDYRHGVKILVTNLMGSGANAENGAQAGVESTTEGANPKDWVSTIFGFMFQAPGFDNAKKRAFVIIMVVLVLTFIQVNREVGAITDGPSAKDPKRGDHYLVHNYWMIMTMLFIFAFLAAKDVGDLTFLTDVYKAEVQPKTRELVGTLVPGASDVLPQAVNTFQQHEAAVIPARSKYFFDPDRAKQESTLLSNSYNERSPKSGGALADALTPPALRLPQVPAQLTQAGFGNVSIDEQEDEPGHGPVLDDFNDPASNPKNKSKAVVVLGGLITMFIVMNDELLFKQEDAADGLAMPNTNRLHPVFISYILMTILLLMSMYLIILRPLFVDGEGNGVRGLNASPVFQSSVGPQSSVAWSLVAVLAG